MMKKWNSFSVCLHTFQIKNYAEIIRAHKIDMRLSQRVSVIAALKAYQIRLASLPVIVGLKSIAVLVPSLKSLCCNFCIFSTYRSFDSLSNQLKMKNSLITSGRSNNASILIDCFEKLSDDKWNTLDTFYFFLCMEHFFF